MFCLTVHCTQPLSLDACLYFIKSGSALLLGMSTYQLTHSDSRAVIVYHQNHDMALH